MERLIRKTTAHQVAETIEVAILAGEFDRGGRLPPERKLAAMLGVCRLTLREGLNRLVARGILIAVPGIGTFVSSVETTQSLDLLASQYLMEKVPQKKVELVRHFLETRRFLLSSILATAVKRATDAGLEWIADAFVRMVGAAQFSRDLRSAAEMEIRALHIAAERADLYHFWLMLNSLRDFFRVARDEIVAGSRLDQYERRGEELITLIRRRDAEAIVRYVSSEYEPADRVQLAQLERRALKGRKSPSDSPGGHHEETEGSSAVHAPRSASSQLPPGDGERSGQPDDRSPGETVRVSQDDDDETETAERALPRTDPASWHRWFIQWYHRNFQCNPWDNPDEVPPGPSIDDGASPGANPNARAEHTGDDQSDSCRRSAPPGEEASSDTPAGTRDISWSHPLRSRSEDPPTPTAPPVAEANPILLTEKTSGPRRADRAPRPEGSGEDRSRDGPESPTPPPAARGSR